MSEVVAANVSPEIKERRKVAYRILVIAYGEPDEHEVYSGLHPGDFGVTDDCRKGYFKFFKEGKVAKIDTSQGNYDGVAEVQFGTCGHIIFIQKEGTAPISLHADRDNIYSITLRKKHRYSLK